ncbi:MAG: Druantia anti-phage system protein DruA [Acidiferrobacter sp.]
MRDRFIEWITQQRQDRFHLIANNARFLILPWAHCPGLASKILGRVARQGALRLTAPLWLPPDVARDFHRTPEDTSITWLRS